MFDLCSAVLTSRAGVQVDVDDLAHVELKSVSSEDTVFTKSIFVRFHSLDLRYAENKLETVLVINHKMFLKDFL